MASPLANQPVLQGDSGPTGRLESLLFFSNKFNLEKLDFNHMGHLGSVMLNYWSGANDEASACNKFKFYLIMKYARDC